MTDGFSKTEMYRLPSKFKTLKPTLLYSNTQSLVGFFSDLKMRDLE